MCTKNRGPWKLATVASGGSSLTVTDPDGQLIDDTAAAAALKTKYVRNGTDLISFLIEEAFSDLTGAYVQFAALYSDQMALTLNAQQAIIRSTGCLPPAPWRT